MRFALLRIVCAIALCLLINNEVAAQGYHQLTVDDFQANQPQPDRTNSIAYTHCSIDFHYRAISENGHYRLTFDIRLILDKDQSWIDKRRILSDIMLAEVLKHEQGHYIIAYMEQQEVLRVVNRTHFNENYQAQANAIFDRIDAKYKQLTLDYDEDTRHMLNRVQQHSWDVYFKKRLIYMPPIEKA
jgi:hypothetical protein